MSPRRRTSSISYLRVSVTDRCNQRCVYCMPAAGVPLKSHADILRYEEIERVVRAAVSLGVRSVRLTGGEPLVRRGLVEFAGTLAGIPGLTDLSLTTNGVLLAELARPLRQTGLGRLSLSLDTLQATRYREITRTDLWSEAWAGLRAALEAGFDPVKVNTVVVRGLNDDEIEDMALLAAGAAGAARAIGTAGAAGVAGAAVNAPFLPGRVVWRFIELMPLGEGRAWGPQALVGADEIVLRLRNLAVGHGLPFTEAGAASGPYGAGPSRYYRFGSAWVGVISPMTHGFCAECNRLRLTSDGKIHPCLASPCEVDLAGPLRAGLSQEGLARLLAEAAAMKPEAHRLLERRPELERCKMSRLGG
jgi:cyclic pyranopterin phosphate synthase